MVPADQLKSKWMDFRPSKTQAFWFGAGAVALTLVLGFGPGGWLTAANAEAQVAKAAEDARQELAAAVCVDGFMEAKDAPARLAELQKLSWYERSDTLAAKGFATMPDRDAPNRTVAILCATQLSEMTPKAH